MTVTTPSAAPSVRPRKSVAVSAEDLRDLDLIRRSPQAAGLDARVTTESAVLAHALHEGIRVLREAQEGALYAAEAAERADSVEARAETAQRRERRARDGARGELLYP